MGITPGVEGRAMKSFGDVLVEVTPTKPISNYFQGSTYVVPRGRLDRNSHLSPAVLVPKGPPTLLVDEGRATAERLGDAVRFWSPT
ncbi:MAG: hypothetical protein GKR86_06360 [Ilumatobacter sp.]|nr:hypothetical protein [bacterium]NKB40663.1 hypothetical protein [Ilumatobacter sp.]